MKITICEKKIKEQTVHKTIDKNVNIWNSSKTELLTEITV